MRSLQKDHCINFFWVYVYVCVYKNNIFSFKNLDIRNTGGGQGKAVLHHFKLVSLELNTVKY